MHINLPDRIPTEDLNRDLAMVLEVLADNGLTSVGEVRITLRAYGEDNRECYPADETGHHDMGFTLARPAEPEAEDYRELNWNFREPKPRPNLFAPGEPRGLNGLLGSLPSKDS